MLWEERKSHAVPGGPGRLPPISLSLPVGEGRDLVPLRETCSAVYTVRRGSVHRTRVVVPPWHGTIIPVIMYKGVCNTHPYFPLNFRQKCAHVDGWEQQFSPSFPPSAKILYFFHFMPHIKCDFTDISKLTSLWTKSNSMRP